MQSWAHEYRTPQWSARYSRNGPQQFLELIVYPANTNPSDDDLYSGNIYTLDVPFTTYPLLGQQLRDQGIIVSWIGEGLIPQTPMDAKYAPHGDESNNFSYTATQGPYAYDPLFVDEAPSAQFKTNMSKGAPLAYLAHGGAGYDPTPLDPSTGKVVDDLLETNLGGFPDAWGLKHVGASLIAPQALVGLAYFEVAIVALPGGGTPANQSFTLAGNRDAGTYIHATDADLTCQTMTLKFQDDLVDYLSPAIGVVPSTFVDKSWKSPTVCYGRIIGLDQDPSQYRSIGCFPSEVKFGNLDARVFEPGSYWLHNPARYETTIDDYTHITGYSQTWYEAGGEWYSEFYSTVDEYENNPYGYTDTWTPPAYIHDNTLVQIETALTSFDRNPLITNDEWLLTFGGTSISGSGALGIGGVYLIDSGQPGVDQGYTDIPVTGPTVGQVGSAIAAYASAIGSNTGITEYWYDPTLGDSFPVDYSGLGLVTLYLATDPPTIPLGPGVPYPITIEPNPLPPYDDLFGEPTSWRYIAEIGGNNYDTMLFPSTVDDYPAFPKAERITGSVSHIASQFASGSVSDVTLLGNFFGGSGVGSSNYTAEYNGFSTPTPAQPVSELQTVPSPGPPVGVNAPGKHTWVFKGRADQLASATQASQDAALGLGVWSGVDLGVLKEKDVIMVAVDVDKHKIWFGKNNKWYDTTGATTYAPGSKELKPTMLLDQGTKYYPACSARWGRTKLQMLTGAATTYKPPSGFTAYNTITIPNALKGSP
jgi:hypothetical protein